MNKPEHEFWCKLRAHVPGFVQRIETSTGNGVPDVYCCAWGKPYWLELKVETEQGEILIRKEQWAWAKNHKLFGGRSFFLVLMLDSSLLLFRPDQMTVAAYGKGETYVEPVSRQVTRVLKMAFLSETLKTNLFT